VDPLSWLGLRNPLGANLAAIQEALRTALPDDEPVIVRYVVVVCILLTRVAAADGRVAACEIEHLRSLLRGLERLPTDSVERVCRVLRERVPVLDREELESCFAELRSLCDAAERRKVMGLLAELARADGTVSVGETRELAAIADALGVPWTRGEAELPSPAAGRPLS
jgi:DnaJ like chaperone protein